MEVGSEVSIIAIDKGTIANIYIATTHKLSIVIVGPIDDVTIQSKTNGSDDFVVSESS